MSLIRMGGRILLEMPFRTLERLHPVVVTFDQKKTIIIHRTHMDKEPFGSVSGVLGTLYCLVKEGTKTV